MNASAETPLVVVSIVNWNTPAATLECLDAIERLAYPRLRTIIVDNASRDDSVARLRARAATVLRSPRNEGFAAGHARAWHEAEGCGADAIWLVNSDAIVEPDALTHLVAAWREHGDAIYGGLSLQRGEGDRAWIDIPQKFLDPSASPRPFRRDRTIAFDANWRERAPLRVGAVSGVSMLLPLALTRRHGWLDESWFMYCEETDYCYRLRERGVDCWLVPRSRVWHTQRGSQRGRAGVADVMRYYEARNQIRLARRHAGRTVAALIAAKKFARALAVASFDPARARWLLRGAVDGLRGRSGRPHAPDDAL
jgi:GT2 family glycosyltransferase